MDLSDRSAKPIEHSLELSQEAHQYLELLLNKNIAAASNLVITWHRDKVLSLKDIYFKIFTASQQEMGRRWEKGISSVADEHYCTAATQMIMSRLYPMLFDGTPKDYTFVGVCAEGNHHELPMRIVTDFFEMEGWDSHYLGSGMPNVDVLDFLIQNKCHVLGISVSFPVQLPNVTQLISDCRQKFGRELKVIVGGYAFALDGSLVKKVDADGFAGDAEAAVALGLQLISRGIAS